MAYSLLQNIIQSGTVSLDGILKSDAQGFTHFGSDSLTPKDWHNLDNIDFINPLDFARAFGNLAARAHRLFQDPFNFGGWICEDLRDWLDLPRDGKYHVYDPLVLDLDGDGIETVGSRKLSGALFDHDGDGIRTATGWQQGGQWLCSIARV